MPLTAITYHNLIETNQEIPGIHSFSVKNFIEQIKFINKIGTFITEEELLYCISKNLSFNKNYFLLTFDDSFKSQFILAKPILDYHGIEGFFAISGKPFEKKEFLTQHNIQLIRGFIGNDKLIFEELVEKIDNNPNFLISEFESYFLSSNHYPYDLRDARRLKILIEFLSIKKLIYVVDNFFNNITIKNGIKLDELYMSEDDLFNLSKKHILCCHSYNHERLSHLSMNKLEEDIILNKLFIQKYQTKVSGAIYPYGAVNTLSMEVFNKYSNYYKYGFTTERAINLTSNNSLAFARIDCNDFIDYKEKKLLDRIYRRRYFYEN